MENALNNFYLKQEEPDKSCLLALKDLILSLDTHITHEWKYGMPFFCYGKKMFCYLWIHKSHKLPYIGIVDGNLIDHKDLVQEKRSRMKILLIDPNKDLPVKKIKSILKQSIEFAKKRK